MNNRGFTIMELLAVIVILGILSGTVVIGVTRYRQDVKEKELINLHSTIEAAYDDRRSDLYLQGETPSSEISFCQDGEIIMDIAYNGEKLTCDEVTEDSYLAIKVKGDLLQDSSYTSGKGESNYIKDGTCVVNATKVKKGSDYELSKSCQKTSAGSFEPSKEEITCIYLKTDREVLLDDFNDSDSLCRYFKG